MHNVAGCSTPVRDLWIQWVIYAHPQDYPNHYVVRPHAIGVGYHTPLAYKILAKTLREARSKIPAGLALIARSEQDDWSIEEVWL